MSTIHNYTVQDLLSLLPPLLLAPLFCVLPAMIIARLTNAFQYQTRSPITRLVIATALSTAIVPAAAYLLSKMFGLHISALLIVSLAIVSAFDGRKSLVQAFKQVLPAACNSPLLAALLAIWSLWCALLLVDLQLGDSLFNSAVMYDWVKNVAITDSIRLTGVPPANFFVFPGHVVSLYYYYFWHTVSAMLALLSQGSSVCASLWAAASVAIWTGYALISTITIGCKLLYPSDCSSRLMQTSVALLFLSGLEGPITWVYSMVLGLRSRLFSIEQLSSQQISSFINSMVWETHHIEGLVAALLGSLLLRQQLLNNVLSWPLTCMTALAFATAVGSSLYPSLPVALSWIFIFLVFLVRKDCQRALIIATNGLAALIVTAPFLLEMSAHHMPAQVRMGLPVFFWIKDVVAAVSPNQAGQALFSLGVLEPLRFIVLLGPFLIPSIWYFAARKQASSDLHCLPLIAACLFVTCFIHSTGRDDNMAWRSVLPLQAILLIWCARGLCSGPLPNIARKIALTLICVGLLSTACNLWVQRCFNFYHQDGQRVLASRQIFSILCQRLSKEARIQASLRPDLFTLCALGLLYGHRQAIAVDPLNSVIFGVDAATYNSLASEITPLFNNATTNQFQTVCRKYGIDALVLRDTDPAWTNKNCWTAKRVPDFSNQYCRAYVINQAALVP